MMYNGLTQEFLLEVYQIGKGYSNFIKNGRSYEDKDDFQQELYVISYKILNGLTNKHLNKISAKNIVFFALKKMKNGTRFYKQNCRGKIETVPYEPDLDNHFVSKEPSPDYQLMLNENKHFFDKVIEQQNVLTDEQVKANLLIDLDDDDNIIE